MSSDDWDWADAKTRYLTFGLHDYPARMIPQIPQRLLQRFLSKSNHGFNSNSPIVVDPFCGSGAVLTSARLNGFNAFGIDINPLAKLISEVQATPIDNEFDSEAKTVRLHIAETGKEKIDDFTDVDVYEFPNSHHWFRIPILQELSWLRTKILSVENDTVRRFLWFCFSTTQFKVSNIDRGSSRFIRAKKTSNSAPHTPRPLDVFLSTFDSSITQVKVFSERCSLNNYTNVSIGDARRTELQDESVDIVVTSPPYGEERNTLDYMRWSKLSLYWMGMTRKRLLDLKKFALGSKLTHENLSDNLKLSTSDINVETPSKTATNVLHAVAREKPKRAQQSVSFFHDFLMMLEEIERILVPGAYACIVVGDRSISGQSIDMNRVTIELVRKTDLTHVISYTRRIPRKLIPSWTPTGLTISKENVVVLCKKR